MERTWEVALVEDRTAVVTAEKSNFAFPPTELDEQRGILEADLIFSDGETIVAAWPAGSWLEIYDSEKVRIIKHRGSRKSQASEKVEMPPGPTLLPETEGEKECEE